MGRNWLRAVLSCQRALVRSSAESSSAKFRSRARRTAAASVIVGAPGVGPTTRFTSASSAASGGSTPGSAAEARAPSAAAGDAVSSGVSAADPPGGAAPSTGTGAGGASAAPGDDDRTAGVPPARNPRRMARLALFTLAPKRIGPRAWPSNHVSLRQTPTRVESDARELLDEGSGAGNWVQFWGASRPPDPLVVVARGLYGSTQAPPVASGGGSGCSRRRGAAGHPR